MGRLEEDEKVESSHRLFNINSNYYWWFVLSRLFSHKHNPKRSISSGAGMGIAIFKIEGLNLLGEGFLI